MNHRTIDSEISKVTQWVENVVCLLGSELVAECEYRRGQLSGDTAPGGGGQSRRVWLVEAGPVHPCDGQACVQGQAQVHQDHRENCHQCNVKC